jgi:hypothetical protein
MATKSITKKRRKTRTEWAKECRDWQRKTVEGFIGLGKTLIKAKADLDHGEWLPFLRDDLKIHERVAQELMRLARNPRFANTRSSSYLPSSFSALTALSRLSDDDFEAGKASGAINPRTTTKQARLMVVPVVSRRVKIKNVAYVGPTEPLSTGWGSSERRHNTIEPVPPEQQAGDAPPPDLLVTDLVHIEDQLRTRLTGDRLRMALAGLEQIRAALAEGTVMPFSRSN